MSWVKAKDISQFQGSWQDTGESIVMIKMSGGDGGSTVPDGLYFDTHAASNYPQAVAAGKAVGGYHFAGGTDPIKEADFFIRAMSPVAENDVFALDWEVSHPDPVNWCLQFVNRVHDKLNVWPLIYMNLSTLNAHDWSPVLTNCGLWLADWSVSPDDTIPTSHVYVMQQYADGPGYDHDAWFGTVDEFKKYGWHAPVVIQPPQPAHTPLVTPPTTQTPVETSQPPSDPQPEPGTVVKPEPPQKPSTNGTVIDVVVKPSKPQPVVSPVKVSEFNRAERVVMKLGRYNKFWIGLAGAILTYLSQHYGSSTVVQDAVLIASVLGIYAIPNVPSESAK